MNNISFDFVDKNNNPTAIKTEIKKNPSLSLISKYIKKNPYLLHEAIHLMYKEKEENNLISKIGLNTQKTFLKIKLQDDKQIDGPDQTEKDLLQGENFFNFLTDLSFKKNKIEEKEFIFEISTDENGIINFICCVPNTKLEEFNLGLLSSFPKLQIETLKEPLNPFIENKENFLASAYSTEPALKIQTYKKLNSNPINSILKLIKSVEQQGEKISFQFRIGPISQDIDRKFNKILRNCNKYDIKYLINLNRGFFEENLHDFFPNSFKEKVSDEGDKQKLKQSFEEKVEKKLLNFQCLALISVNQKNKFETILSQINTTFGQYNLSGGNQLKFKKNSNQKLLNYILKSEIKTNFNYLNLEEIASILNFTNSGIESVKDLEIAKKTSTISSALIGGDKNEKEFTVLGINKSAGAENKIYINAEDRLRHFYTIGQTGTGKTTLLKNMIIQDIKQGRGACMIDPHGSDILDILAQIPKERIDDVIYFDPGTVDYSIGLNILEYDPEKIEQKTFVVEELLSIFKKLFSGESMGPAFEQYFRNAALLVLDSPQTGNTLLDISRVFSQEDYRNMKIFQCTTPTVKDFWVNVATKTSGEMGFENFAQYITSKFDVFINNHYLKLIISQPKSGINFREIMDKKKILLVNLSKGKLGETSSYLLGLIIVSKFLIAALSRTDTKLTETEPFYLYIDEFQNVTTDSISQILSEARKYKLSLNLAHQYIAQLPDNIKAAVFGNVGNLCVFRVGSEDANYLETYFKPEFQSKDISSISNRNAYIKILADGEPQKPFNMQTLKPEEGDYERASKIIQYSSIKYGKSRQEIEEFIEKKFNN